MIRFFVLLLVIQFHSYAVDIQFEEEQCATVATKICLDESEKVIEGYKVKQCWKYKEISKCVSHEHNHCVPFEENRGCHQVEGKCLERSVTGLCKSFKKKFVCGNKLSENQEVKLIDSQFTVLKDEKDLAECAANIKDQFCEIVSEECVEPAKTKQINGKDIYKECWKWDRKYQCRTGTSIDECKDYKEKGCKELNRQCVHQEDGRCEHYVVKFECDEKTVEQIDCIASKFCIGGNCEEQVRNVNTNFGLAASYLGALSQMGKDQKGCTCNKEIDPTCTTHSVNDDGCMLFKGEESVCRKYTGEFNCCANRGFLRKIASCNEEEKALSRKKEARLCHFVGTYAGKGLIEKFKKKSSYCCFNSPIARIIQEQGRSQLGKDWGDPRSPNCNPLTLAEIKKIDFSKIDFSELYADLKQKAKSDFAGQKDRMQQQLKSYENNPESLANVLKGKMQGFYEK
jgi:conjugal transfer mating pair stabilization protein TraN